MDKEMAQKLTAAVSELVGAYFTESRSNDAEEGDDDAASDGIGPIEAAEAALAAVFEQIQIKG